MPEARRMILNPADRTQGYVLWSHARITAFGGAIPIDFSPAWDNEWAAYDLWIEPGTWSDPKGLILTNDGARHSINGALGGGDPLPGGAAWGLYGWFSPNPAANGQGYVFSIAGNVEKYGLGTPDLSPLPPEFGNDRLRCVRHSWDEDKWIALGKDGGAWSSEGIASPQWTAVPGSDLFRTIAVRDWSESLPPFWISSYAGDVFRANAAENARRGIMFPGRGDVVRDMDWESDGTGGDPLILILLLASGERYRHVVSDPPTVEILEPVAGSTITTTTRPRILWAFTDPNRDAQEWARAKVFTEDVATSPGFDADTSPAFAFWDVDERNRTVVDPDEFGAVVLPDGQYRAAVAARDTSGLYSDWDVQEEAWTIDTATAIPSTPSVSAAIADGWAVELTVTGAEVLIDLECTDDPPSGEEREWVTVRDSAVAPDGGGAVLLDWEAPLNRPRWYRCRSVDGDLVSEWSAEDQATVPEPAEWLWSDPLVPDSVVILDVVPPVSWRQPIPAGVHRPAGRRNALVGRGILQSAEAALKLRTETAAAMATQIAAVNPERTSLLRSPYGQTWYVAVVDAIEPEMLQWGANPDVDGTVWRDAHETTISIVEVDRP